MILHNMIIRFEERGQSEGTVEWARQEGEEFMPPVGNADMAGDNPADGTPGQEYRTQLMDLLLDSPECPSAVRR